MKWFPGKYFSFMWVLIVLGQIDRCNSKGVYCIEEERVALVQLKDFLIAANSYDIEHVEHDQFLPSWVDNKESDCCSWERVSCNPVTGRVTGLLLDGVRKQLPYYSPLNLNSSLFLPFHELIKLDLSENIFSCCMENEGLENLSNLKKLEMLNFAFNQLNNFSESFGSLISLKTLNLSATVSDYEPFPAQELSTLRNLEILDLSYNHFNSSLPVEGYGLLSKLSKLEHLDISKNYFDKEIFKFLIALSGLKYLSLENNDMEGSLSNHELFNLSNLEVLNLGKNNLKGSLPIKDLCDCRNLKVLDLSSNSFVGSIPPDIEALTSLKALSLSDNQLNGSLPIPGLCNLTNLQELDISRNSFEGSLPQCLENLSSLTLLDLSENQFTGRISPSLISKLTFLEYFNIKINHFEGSLSFSSFVNHSRLEVVDLGYNKLEVETESSYWVPKFQLKVLALPYCNLNKHTGEIPKFLFDQHKLEVVDLSSNNLKGKFPSWLLEKPTLNILSLRNNSFNAQISLPISPLANLLWMDLSNNGFNGQLQENAGEILPNLTYLNLSRNSFEGILPPSICGMSSLNRLDLSFNTFSGEVPTQLVEGCCPNLIILKLSNNNFHGQILSSHNFNMTELLSLHLNDNKFSGTVSNALYKSSLLVKLDVGNNYMSGVIPSWIQNTTNLQSLIMKENFFTGQLLSDFGGVLFLDLSINKLSGALPCQMDVQFLEHMHLQGNKLTGPIPEAFLNSSFLLTLDLRDNRLSGSIPTSVSTLSNLRVILLSGNHLSGAIPDQLCHLHNLSLLDLSNNSLSCSIPRCLSSIAFGKLGASDRVFKVEEILTYYTPPLGTYGNLMIRLLHFHDTDEAYKEQDEVEFVTKSRPSAYKGDILNFMSGMDLSCNNLTGEIPSELGQLGWIHALNLSHNHLVGSIPKTFSNLKQIESLDLSHNSLSGEIPSELTNLNFLEVFSVAHNNLSGRIPDGKAQFGTFDNSSYEGNPFLCGAPLEKNCRSSDDNESPPSPETRPDVTDGKWYEVDPVFFSASFSVSYLIFFAGFVGVLYVNPYWRQRLVDHTEEFLYSCYYSVSNVLHKLSTCF